MMMSRKKIGTLVLAAAILVSGALVFSGSDKSETAKKLADKNSSGKFFLQKDDESLLDERVDDLSKFLTSQSEKVNLTKILAEKLAGNISELNGGNAGLLGLGEDNQISVPNENVLSKDFIDGYVEELRPGLEIVGVGELRRSEDNSAEAFLSYYTQFQGILSEYRKQADFENNLAGFSKDQNKNYIIAIINAFNGLIRDLKRLLAPSDLLSSHMKLINIYSAQKEAFAALLFINEDPLRAAAGLTSFSSTEEELEIWRQDLVVKMREKGIEARITN